MLRQITAILVSAALALYLPQAAETGKEPVLLQEGELYAKSAVLMDGDSGRILYEKNAHEILPMASTTKIMTCILAIENGNLEDEVTVSAYAAGMPKVHLGMREGERYRLSDLLYSLMLESHNDSAAAIAEHVGGSVEGFSDMMNQKARDIGLQDTFFITPNGLDAQKLTEDETGEQSLRTHSTTAAELARIMKYCITESPGREKFLEITAAQSHSFADAAGVRSHTCNNHNAFLHMMDGALSGKTGFTAGAGYCYVGALSREGKTFIVALLACGWPNNKSYKWSDTRKLMEYGLENYAYEELPSLAADEIAPVLVENGRTEELGGQAFAMVKVREGERKELLLREDETVEIKRKMKEILQAPVKAGDVAGYVQYLVNDEVYRTDVVAVVDGVKAIDYMWCLKMIWERLAVCPKR